MLCHECGSPFVFVTARETAAESTMTCSLCGRTSPLTQDEWLEELLAEKGSEEIRNALQQFRDGATAAAVEQATALVDAEDVDLSRRAVKALGAMPSDEAAIALNELARTQPDELRDLALKQLGGLKRRLAAEFLVEWHERVPSLRPLTGPLLLAGGEVAEPVIVERLRNCTPGDDNEWEKLLLRLGTSSACASLVRWRVAFWLTQVETGTLTPVQAGDLLYGQGRPAVPELLTALDHANPRVRLAALRALVQARDQTALAALHRLADDPDQVIADYVEYELSHWQPQKTESAKGW